MADGSRLELDAALLSKGCAAVLPKTPPDKAGLAEGPAFLYAAADSAVCASSASSPSAKICGAGRSSCSISLQNRASTSSGILTVTAVRATAVRVRFRRIGIGVLHHGEAARGASTMFHMKPDRLG